MTVLLYRIVHKGSPTALEDSVQSHIDQGWLPVGGVQCSQTTVHEGSVVWAQAMTLSVEDSEPTPERDTW